jgi:hypothetical protein
MSRMKSVLCGVRMRWEGIIVLDHVPFSMGVGKVALS